MSVRDSLFPLILITVGTVTGLSATDLILPAIPILPTVVAGSAESAQWVLAGFALGTGAGLLLFGELGARYRIADILIVSLLAFSALSVLATLTGSLIEMSLVRFFQGVAASASAVYAPVMVKNLFAGPRAIAMIGRIGSIESMAPAIAPIVGLLLLNAFGWKSSFFLVALIAAVIAVLWLLVPGLRGRFGRLDSVDGGYTLLLRNRSFLRYALSQAGTLGAVLAIVFSAPTVITTSMGGTLSDFIVMQVLGITFFVIAANMTGRFTHWWGEERTIFIGSLLSALGCTALLFLSLFSSQPIALLWLFFVFVNLGLGIRGPVGFYKALLASQQDDSRGSALVILLVMLTAAGGTAVIAREIEEGLFPLSLVATVIAVASVLALIVLPAEKQEKTA